MVDTIYFPSRRNSFKFLLAFSILHHVLLQHFDFYSDYATLFLAQVWGGGYMNISSQPPLMHYIYIYMCVHFFFS